MTTEIIGLLIILGALVYVILRHQILPDSEKSKPREAEEATDKLRRQMENSADQIIARMEAHTERLERLVREADEKSRKLDEQMTAARTLEKSAAIMMAAHEIESVKTTAPQNDDFGNLLNETLESDFENWISRYIIPITIDQRYGESELAFINSIIRG